MELDVHVTCIVVGFEFGSKFWTSYLGFLQHFW